MADVKLFQPQRLTDNPDGGGLATANEVVDGQVNNLFDDISRIDRVNGELSLRKVFAQAATADTELYSDLHAIVQAPPQDPRVSCVLFDTGSWADERSNAQSQVERYLDESVLTRMVVYDRQLQGQRTVMVFQRPEHALPEIGEVYALKDEDADFAEFIRVQDLEHVVETFTHSDLRTYQVRVVTLTISQPLSREFAGSQPNIYFEADDDSAVVRRTIVSDAARYKGVVALAENAAIGDLTVKVESVFSQLVPATTAEVAVTDAVPAGQVVVVPSGGEVLETALTGFVSLGAVYLQAAGSLGMVVEAIASASVLEGRWREVADGVFVREFGVMNTDIRVGPGRRSVHIDSTTVSRFRVRYVPAAIVSKSGLSHQTPVEVANRGYVYTASLRPLPEPGTATVSFRSGGKWYLLQDDGSGAMVGDAGVGSGLVNFVTGSVAITLGALPDVGSSVIFTWGAGSEYEIRADDVQIEVPAASFVLDQGNCEPGTLELTWLSGGAVKSAADDGSGNITGDGTGQVLYATGEVSLRPTLLPDSNSTVNADYSGGVTEQELFTPALSGGSVILSATSVPIAPGSVRIDYLGSADLSNGTGEVARTLRDDGLGQLVAPDGAVVAGSVVDYQSGQISFDPDFMAPVAEIQRSTFEKTVAHRVSSGGSGGGGTYKSLQGSWATSVEPRDRPVSFIAGGPMTLRYKATASPDTDVVGEEHLLGGLTVDLTPLLSSAVVPGGLVFKLGTRTYYEGAGSLYYGMDVATGAGTAAGTINYDSGFATITAWEGGFAPSFDVIALLTELAPLPTEVLHGRTPGSPLRPGTFFLQANRYSDGALITGLADNNGDIETLGMHGFVDATTGVFSVAFGAFVLDSSLTIDEKAEPWYDVANVDEDGYIWRPAPVMPGTIRFNCVVQAALPQDPDIIKVNPVRLPMDGRVQSIRPGDTLVIHDTQPQTMPSPLTAGQVVALARSGVESVALYDQAGVGVDPALYTLDKETAEVTFTTPLDLSAYTEPLTLLHTIEDMALCLDAQITGEVSLGQALTHAYSAGQSLVSSALILGNAQGRYERLFAQATWTNVWSDTLIGSAPSSGAQYNDATWPVLVLNRDAITQRWRLQFTSSTAFNIVGEELGVIGTGTTSADVAPVNPATGQPYFTVNAAGFGAGWATGNLIRFNTVAAGGPIWTARTVLSGPATQQDDLVRLQLRWDKD